MPAPRDAPVPRSRKVGDALLAVAGVAAVLAAGLLVFGRRRDPEPRPDPGAVLLAADLPMSAEGASTRFRLRAPGDVVISVEGPPGAEVSLTLGTPQPPAPDGVDRPGPGPSWTAKAGDPGKRLPLFSAGNYVLRVEARSSPPPSSVRVAVRAVPAGD